MSLVNRIRTSKSEIEEEKDGKINKNEKKYERIKQINEEINEEEDEPVTPAGRVFMQPDFYCGALCIIGFEMPIDVQASKKELMNTLTKHKRFCSLMRLNNKGRECWVKTQVNIDDHVIVPEIEESWLDWPNLVEEYAAELSNYRLDVNKPLWEIHVLNNLKHGQAKGVGIFVFHHSLGDGTSLMSLFLACTRRVDNPDMLPTVPSSTKAGFRRYSSRLSAIWTMILVVWYSITEIIKFLVMQFFQSDSETVLKGYRGVEHEPSKLSILDFKFEDLKTVRNATHATINDVLLAVTSIALERYLKCHMQQKHGSSVRVRALVMVNTRPSAGLQELSEMMKYGSKARWGNNMGYMLIPLMSNSLDNPLEYVKRATDITKRKKLSFEAPFSYYAGSSLMKLLGPKVGVVMTYNSALHTTLSMSNVVGPLEQVAFAGNPILYMVPCFSGLLPQGLILHMTSYMGTMKITILVKKKLVPDLEFLSQCFYEAFQELLASSQQSK